MNTAAASTDPAPAGKSRRQRRKSVPTSSTSPEPPRPLVDAEQPMLPLDDSADPPSPPKQRVYVARKRMTVDGQQILPGDVVPGADKFLRVEGWVRAGYLNEEWR